MTKLTEIEAELVALARTGISSKELRKAIEKAFPKASKKDLRLAAFAAMIAIVEKDPSEALRLQDFAIGDRATPPTTI